jgi:hypothetical protein
VGRVGGVTGLRRSRLQVARVGLGDRLTVLDLGPACVVEQRTLECLADDR